MLFALSMAEDNSDFGLAEAAQNWSSPNFDAFLQDALASQLPSRLQAPQQQALPPPPLYSSLPLDVKHDVGNSRQAPDAHLF